MRQEDDQDEIIMSQDEVNDSTITGLQALMMPTPDIQNYQDGVGFGTSTNDCSDEKMSSVEKNEHMSDEQLLENHPQQHQVHEESKSNDFYSKIFSG